MKNPGRLGISKKWNSCELCTAETAPKDNEITWIQCTPCRRWYHVKCIGELYCIDTIKDYHCRFCEPLHGSSTCNMRVEKLLYILIWSRSSSEKKII